MSDLHLAPRSAFAGLLTPGRHGRTGGGADVTVRPCDGLAMARLIARKGKGDDLAAAIRMHHGLDLPATPKRVTGGGLAFIWSGPGQWLAVAEAGQSGEAEGRISAPPLPLAGEVGTAPAVPSEGEFHPPEQPSPGYPGGYPTPDQVRGRLSPAKRERRHEQTRLGRDLVRELMEDVGAFAAVSDQSDGFAVLRVSGPRARDALIKGVGLDLHPRAFGPGDAAVTVIAHVGAQLWQLDDGPTYEIAVFRSLAGSFWRWLEASAAEFGCEAGAERDRA